jgi:hypothetical protein
MCKKVKTPKTQKLESILFFQSIHLDTIGHFSTNLRPIFLNSFPTTIIFYFLFKAQYCLETYIYCVWNCVTPLYTPHQVQFTKIIFFKNVLLPHLKCYTCSEGYIWKVSMRRIGDIFNQGPYKSQFCVKWVDALLFQENGLAITFIPLIIMEPLLLEARISSF